MTTTNPEWLVESDCRLCGKNPLRVRVKAPGPNGHVFSAVCLSCGAENLEPVAAQVQNQNNEKHEHDDPQQRVPGDGAEQGQQQQQQQDQGQNAQR